MPSVESFGGVGEDAGEAVDQNPIISMECCETDEIWQVLENWLGGKRSASWNGSPVV